MAPTCTDYVFCFNNKLPWKHEVVLSILEVSKSDPVKETKQRKEVMICMVNSLTKLWETAFGSTELLLMTKHRTRQEIVKLLKDFHASVTLPGKSADAKRKVEYRGKSQHQLRADWLRRNQGLFCFQEDSGH